MSRSGYVYTVHCPAEETDLAAAEAWAFTGREMRDHVVPGACAVDIARAAYLRHCIHVQVVAPSLDELIEACLARQVAYDRFRLHFLRPPPRVSEHKDETILRVANAIIGRPDLTNPAVHVAAVATAEAWYFGRLISTGRSHWLAGIERPIHFSSALPQRFSRAVVNLVASPGDTLIDPCCGVGTPVIEALEIGVIAFGADVNRKMLQGLAQNLRHLGLPLRLVRADARQLSGHFDAAVLDLPYGRNLKADQNLYRELLLPLRESARRIAIVAATPLDDLLEELGYRLLRHARVPKGQLVRHVYVAQAAL